jgi:general stress protein YciG
LLTIIAEHGGLKEDGTPDKRVGTGQFAQGQVDPHEAGKQGGQSSGGSTESTGSSDTSSSGKGRKLSPSDLHAERSLTMIIEFAGGKVDPVEAGRKGGQTSN